MSSMAAFLIAVGGVSLILFWLMGRADRVRDRRSAYADGSDTSGISSSNDSNLFSWFGGRSWSSDNSCTTSDSSSTSSWSDSSSCSDSGGGGGGDGGGGGGGD